MKLTKQDIVNIDAWLKRKGIKYIDVRYELIDHLVTEYESIENYPDLSSFLEDRKVWCQKIAKRKQKTVNFGMQRDIWKGFLKLFTNWKSLMLILIISVLIYQISFTVSAESFKKLLWVILFLPLIAQWYLMIYSGLGKKMKKEALSAVYLVNIFSLPQVFVHCVNIVPDFIYADLNIIAPYIFFVTLFNIAAILVFFDKRKQLLIEFELLKNQFA